MQCLYASKLLRKYFCSGRFREIFTRRPKPLSKKFAEVLGRMDIRKPLSERMLKSFKRGVGFDDNDQHDVLEFFMILQDMLS